MREIRSRMSGADVTDWSAVDASLSVLFPTRAIARVLLVNPPDADSEMFRYEVAKRGRYTNYPPYGLAVLASGLRSTGIEVDVINLTHTVLKEAHECASLAEFDHRTSWTKALDAAIAAFKPDLIGITCMFTMTHEAFKQVCSHAAASGIPIAIGGVHVSNDVDRILDDIPEASIAFLRESDTSVLRFVAAVNRTGPVDKLAQTILNIPVKAGEAAKRHYCRAECPPSEAEISRTPAFDLLNISDLSRYGTMGCFYALKPAGTIFATALSNRGCRAQCTFCSVRNFNGMGVRHRDHVTVADELQELVERYGVGHIVWLDDDLLKDEKRALAMFNEIARRNLKLTWDATNGLISASCTDEMVAAMAESGCIAVNMGMESGNPKILREIKKPGTVQNFLKAAEAFRRYEKIYTSVQIMVGFPGETMSMIQDTISVSQEMDCDWYRISPLQPLPNTPIYDMMVAQGVIQDVGSKEVRFMGGGFGKQAEIEDGLRMAELDFHKAFSDIPADAIPPQEKISDIWFYMNYHMNFHRLFHETRKGKIVQQLQFLQAITNVASPGNAFALYFRGVLEKRLSGSVPADLLERLKSRLEVSAYWKDRFQAFGIGAEDLVGGEIVEKKIPSFFPGRRTAA